MSDGTLDSLRRLLDVEEIKQLKARYFRSIDRKEWGEFGRVFARDALLEVPDVHMATRGRDEIVAAVSGALVGTRTVHHGHMPEIEVAGDGTARGIWAMFDYVEWDEQNGTRVGLQGYGHYREEYKREDGEWRIARTRLERLRIDSLGAIPELPS